MRETLRAAREYIKAGNEIRRRGRGESIVEGMEDEPGKVWEALEEVIGKVGGGYGAEDGGGENGQKWMGTSHEQTPQRNNP